MRVDFSFQRYVKALIRYLKKKDGGGYRLNFSHFSVILGRFFFLIPNIDRLEREMNPNTVCVLVRRENKKHVCSTSGNRQLYLSQLSYKLGQLWHLHFYDSFLFLENSILYAWKYEYTIIIMSFRWRFYCCRCPRHQSKKQTTL